MKVRTIEELNDKIAEEIAWRKRELCWIRSTSNTKGIENEYALRSGVPIAYAHFEGAIKNIAQLYLIYVFGQKHMFCDLTDNFIAIGLSGDIKEMKKSKKISIHMDFIDKLSQKSYECSSKVRDDAIDTESNLNASVFREICSTIELDEEKYVSKYTFLDGGLLNLRNKIAHGEKLRDISLDESRFIEICDTVNWLIENFADDVFELAYYEHYLKNNEDRMLVVSHIYLLQKYKDI